MLTDVRKALTAGNRNAGAGPWTTLNPKPTTQNPKLSEPGAVEQGERAEAGRRGSSGAQSPPAGDKVPSLTGSCGLRGKLGRWRVTRQVALIPQTLRRSAPSSKSLFLVGPLRPPKAPCDFWDQGASASRGPRTPFQGLSILPGPPNVHPPGIDGCRASWTGAKNK